MSAFTESLLEILDKPLCSKETLPAFLVYEEILIKYGISNGTILCILLHELEHLPRNNDGMIKLQRSRLQEYYNLSRIALMGALMTFESDGLLIVNKNNRQAVYYRIDVDKLEDIIIPNKETR